MAKKTEQMSVRMDEYTKSRIDKSDLTLIEIIEKGLQVSSAEERHAEEIMKFKKMDHRFNFYDYGIAHGRRKIKPDFGRDESIRRRETLRLQDSLHYKGLQDLEEEGSFFRIILGHHSSS